MNAEQLRLAGAKFPFLNLYQPLLFPTTVDAICNMHTVKRIRTTPNRVVGLVVVYRTGMLAVAGSKYGNSFINFYLA